MIINLNTNLIPIFSGTYNTIWDDVDNELYEIVDSKKYLESIKDAYDGNIEAINETLPDWIKITAFTDTFSPKEYNFSTDTLDFNADLDKEAMLKHLETLESNTEFTDHLRERYTSCDGFMSFTPNNYNDLKEALETESNEFDQSVGALASYLQKPSNNEWTIEMGVWEYWHGNCIGGVKWLD